MGDDTNIAININWDEYWKSRRLSRNRLLLLHHRLITDVFRTYFESKDPNISVLDIGCGDGYFMDYLRNLGFLNLKGIDLSSKSLEIAKLKGHNVAQMDVYELKDEECYDAIIMMDVLEHLDEPLNAIKIIKKSLKEKGFVYISVPICNSVRNRWRRLVFKETRLQQVKKIDETHIHAFTIDDFRRFAIGCGLEIEKYWLTSNPFPFFLQKFGWLQTTTIRNTCGDHLSIVLVKKF
jgi:2-polyprenyl-3-methyl-5-hydroxy-6-metoxy-1,4-benzoquinol methylase